MSSGFSELRMTSPTGVQFQVLQVRHEQIGFESVDSSMRSEDFGYRAETTIFFILGKSSRGKFLYIVFSTKRLVHLDNQKLLDAVIGAPQFDPQ